MKLDDIAAWTLTIPFNVSFRHTSAERSATQALWVQARAGGTAGFGEGCPREYVTAETLESVALFVARHRCVWLGEIGDLPTLKDWARRHREEIDMNPAAWTAVEIALLDLLGKLEGRSIESLLGVPELAGRFRYTAVIGDADRTHFESHLARYLKAGFRDFKIKLSGEHDRDLAKVQALAQAGIGAGSVRADANNLWRDAGAAIRALESLGNAFHAIEEPLRPGDWDGMSRIAAALGTRIILDESLSRASQLDHVPGAAATWIANLRVAKMGGVLRSLDLAREIHRRGMGLIIGAHVGETSVLARAALTVANDSRDALMAQEGAFGTHLLARDVTDPPVMFGAGGVLDVSTLKPLCGGLGLEIAAREADLDATIASR